MPYCKICRQHVTKLVRCHIYPQSMTKEMAEEDGLLLAMSNRNGPRVSISKAGVFDDRIACEACERLFGAADDYAIRFRRAALKLTMPFELRHRGSPALPTFKADAALLHTFAMHTLFRAHLSDRWEHDQIEAPFIETEVRDSLRTRRPTIEAGREVCIVVTRGAVGGYMTAPHLLRQPEFPKYVLQMPHLTFYVDAAGCGLGPGFSDMALRPGNDVTVWRRREPVPAELRWPAEVFTELGDRPDYIFDKLSRRRRT